MFLDKSEGDINITINRASWHDGLSEAIKKSLEEDEKYFFRQALSTPCLNVIRSSRHSCFYDLNNKPYFDFHGNSVHHLGYNNSFIIKRIKKQLDELSFCPRRYTNEFAIEAARMLINNTPSGLDKVLFAPGGSEVNSIAIQIARFYTGNYKVVSFWDSFHGATLDMISVSGENIFRYKSGPLLNGTIQIPSFSSHRGLFCTNSHGNNAQYILEYLDYLLGKEKDIAALIAEPVRNTSVHVPPAWFWHNVKSICEKNGVLLIFDEIATGMGRTGKMFAFEHFNIVPDILTLGKSLGGGIIPFAALVAGNKLDIMHEKAVGHFTHEKNPVGAAAMMASFDYIKKENILKHVKNLEIFCKHNLTALKEKYHIISDVRGLGLLWALEIDRDLHESAYIAEKIMYSCLQMGLSFKVSHGNIILLVPPLTITENDYGKAINILESAIKKVCNN